MSLKNSLKSLNINHQQIQDSVQKIGLVDTARILGYKIENYDNLLASGNLLMLDIQNNAAQNLTEYLNALDTRLNEPCKLFFHNHLQQLESLWFENKHKDFIHDWFSASTLARTYLTKIFYEEEPIETPQLMYLRIAVQLYHDKGFNAVKKAYLEMADQYYTHASPTIFNSAMKKHQLSSCFLSTISDNLESILYEGVGDTGLISRHNGGLGIDISRVRHSEISGAGMSGGIVPMLQVYNAMVRYVDQGGKRRGAATIFLRPHHIDVFEFLQLVNKIGDQYARAHDLNIALWTPWLFWERVRSDSTWTIFCPHHTEKLNDLYGKEFEEQYVKYEEEALMKQEEYIQAEKTYNEYKKKFRTGEETDTDELTRLRNIYHQLRVAKIHHRVVKARELLDAIVKTQQGTGMPYIMHADSANIKSNQRNLGYIRGSNLCVEIVEFSSEKEIASCNLASLNLRMYAKGRYEDDLKECFDFELLGEKTRSVIRNLNQVIDHNWYPLDRYDSKGNLIIGKIHFANKKHRPVGLGISGFAEALHILDLPFVNEVSPSEPHPITRKLNKLYSACVYFNALIESIELAIQDGPYESFQGSPLSEGKFQFDLWAEEFKIRGPNPLRKEEDDLPIDPCEFGQKEIILSNGYIIQPTWQSLKEAIMTFGVRNSLLIALMPTATTAQILRNAETAEAHMSNIYSRKVMNGAYPVVNRFMVKDLEEIGLWNDITVDYLQSNNGSLSNFHQFIEGHPGYNQDYDHSRLEYLQNKYKTMWELSQKIFLQLAADRGRYVCQSQSTNIYLADPTKEQLKALHLYSDMLGLKTGMYYLRQTASETIKLSVDPEVTKKVRMLAEQGTCLMCQ